MRSFKSRGPSRVKQKKRQTINHQWPKTFRKGKVRGGGKLQTKDNWQTKSIWSGLNRPPWGSWGMRKKGAKMEASCPWQLGQTKNSARPAKKVVATLPPKAGQKRKRRKLHRQTSAASLPTLKKKNKKPFGPQNQGRFPLQNDVSPLQRKTKKKTPSCASPPSRSQTPPFVRNTPTKPCGPNCSPPSVSFTNPQLLCKEKERKKDATPPFYLFPLLQ